MTGGVAVLESLFVRFYVCVQIYSHGIFSISPCLIPSYNQINARVAFVVLRVSGPADYTACSLLFLCVCVCQRSSQKSVSGEQIDEYTQETKRLASGNTRQATDTKAAVHCRFWVNSTNTF